MELTIGVILIASLLGSWGMIWYKLGKLTSEVKNHNLTLAEIQKQLETLIIGKGD